MLLYKQSSAVPCFHKDESDLGYTCGWQTVGAAEETIDASLVGLRDNLSGVRDW